MSKVIDAIYEDGVFKPLQDIELKEHERVSLKVINHEEWSRRFNNIIGKIQEKPLNFLLKNLKLILKRR